ncbi:Type I restriction enzyme S subunit [Rubrivivax sp. A210]|uniref:restriction endonuclease subunit S n=1 Tax=Rubrivivax sp. A210 TaxID=2772301 RepID=UPI001917CC78|nr:restriction endonuclease subunit S [Rubrivivax sp. A210]CAD5371745.1 Type I restriction enzyme S subunit [Rubrivivax sp. A210]
MSDWPESWVPATGNTVFELVTSGSRGWAKHYAESGAAFIRVGNLDHDTIRLDLRDIQRVVPPAGAEGERTRLKANDLLVSITAEVGMVGLVPEGLGEAYINQHIALARSLPGVDQRFIAWYLASEADGKRRLREVSRGGTKSGLGLDDIRNVSVPLAPLAEQQRIADKLDTVLARVDFCRDRLARVAPLLKRFRQSVLAAATSGRLTLDFRIHGGDDWTQASPRELKTHCELDVGYAFRSAEFEDEGVRLLRGDNIEPGRCRWIDAKCFPAEKLAELAHFMLREGDVVLAMDRPIISTGLKLARVRASDLPAVLVQRVCRFRPIPQLHSAFLYLVLQSSAFIEHLSSKQNGSSIPHISGGQILSFAFVVPPLEEQTEIVRRVETLFAFADRLQARLTQAQTAVDRLTPSLLSKAFRGELVPQDPADEPAAELLARLARAAADNGGPTRPGPRRGRRPAAVQDTP